MIRPNAREVKRARSTWNIAQKNRLLMFHVEPNGRLDNYNQLNQLLMKLRGRTERDLLSRPGLRPNPRSARLPLRRRV